jgi:predicted small secreted protein
MRNFIKIFGVIALMAVIGFSMAACNDDSGGGGGGNSGGGGGGGNPFVGTWNGYDTGNDAIRLVITSSSFTVTWPNYFNPATYSGTYTYSGNTATFIAEGNRGGTATVSGNTMTGMIIDLGFTVTKM